MSPKLHDLFFKANLVLLVLITLNLWVLLFTNGYMFSIGPLKISSHRTGRLFLYQIILVGLQKLFFNEDFKRFWRRRGRPETPEPKSTRAFMVAILLAITLVSLLAYAKTMHSYFLSDDFEFLSIFNKSPSLSTDLLIGFFKKFGLFRPLSLLTLYIDYLIWDLNPFGFHLTSLLFHIGSACLVFLLLWYLIKDRFIGLTAGLLFAVYPIHLEAVAWISGRFDVTCTFFYLLSLLLFLYFRRSGNFIYQGFSLLAFLGALLCKEMALTLPLVILVVDLFSPGETKSGWTEALKRFLSHWLTLAAYIILRISALGGIAGYSDSSRSLFFLKGNILYDLKYLIFRPSLLAAQQACHGICRPLGDRDPACYVLFHPDCFGQTKELVQNASFWAPVYFGDGYPDFQNSLYFRNTRRIQVALSAICRCLYRSCVTYQSQLLI